MVWYGTKTGSLFVALVASTTTIIHHRYCLLSKVGSSKAALLGLSQHCVARQLQCTAAEAACLQTNMAVQMAIEVDSFVGRL